MISVYSYVLRGSGIFDIICFTCRPEVGGVNDAMVKDSRKKKSQKAVKKPAGERKAQARRSSKVDKPDIGAGVAVDKRWERPEYFQALIENAMEAIVVLDENGTLIYESPSFAHILGLTQEERLGESGFDFVHPDDVLAMAEIFDGLMKKPGSAVHVEVRGRHKDGSWRNLEAVGRNLVNEPAVNGIVVNFRDITDRKQAEAAVLEEGLFRATVLDGLRDGILVVDKDAMVTYVNNAFERMMGYKAEELVGKSALELPTYGDPENLEKGAKLFEQVMKNGYAEPVEMDAVTKDGKVIPLSFTASVLVDAEGNPKTFVAVIRDDTERKKAEEALREAEKRYRAIFDNQLQMVYINDETGAFLDANDYALERLGYTRDDIGKIAFQDLIHPDDMPRAFQTMAGVMEKGYMEHSFECRLVTKSGETIWVETLGIPLELGADHYLGLGIAYETTERKQMEESLLLKENAVEHSINAIAMSDMGGKITYVNQACHDLWGGGSKEELIGKPYWVMLDVVSEDTVKEIATAVLSDQSWEGELSAKNRDGSEVFLQVLTALVKDSQGNPIQTISSFIDITERKRAEQALKESEELSRGMLETAAMGIYLLQDGKFQYVNRLFEEISGYTSKDLIGTYSLDYVYPDDKEAVRAEAIECLKGKRSLPFEYRFVRKDSEIIWVLDRVTSIRRRGERSVLGIFMDITERKQIEAEIADYTRELETLFNIGITVSQTLNLEELLKSVLGRILKVMGMEMGGIYLIDIAAGELVLKAHKGAPAKIIKKIERLKADRVTFPGKPVVVEDAGGDIKLEGMGKATRGLQSFAAVPIIAKENMLGIMGVGSYQPRKFPEREIQLLVNIANQVGMAVDNAQLYGQAVELASTDGLTGLYNRRYLMEQIEREFTRSKRSKVPLSLVMVDLDGLKTINDRYGHNEGDEFLRGLGKMIGGSTRASDIAARWGGDEFMLLAPETDSRAAARIGERIRAQVEDYRAVINGGEVGMSVSVGIASYPDHASDVTLLLQRVDEAMYNAKRSGKNQVCIFSS